MTIDEKQKKNDHNSAISGVSTAYRNAAPYLNIVYVLIASILMLSTVGWFSDKYFQTKPLFTVIGFFFGLGIGFYGFFKSLKQLEKKNH